MRVLFMTLVISGLALPAAALPDLYFSGMLVCDAAPKGPLGSMRRLGPGQEVYVGGTVSNQGNGRASDIAVELRIGNKVIGRQIVPNLRSGMSESFAIEWKPTGAGDYDIQVIIDPTNHVVESDKKNNTAATTLKIAFNSGSSATDTRTLLDPEVVADLEIEGGIMVSPPPTAGALSRISFDIRNRGDAVAENVEVEVRVGGAVVQTIVVPNIAPDHIKSGAVSWKAARGGSSMIEVVIDPKNLLREKTKENNREQKPIEIKRR